MGGESVREPLLQTEVVQSQEHRNQANDSRTAGGGNHASQGEDKTVKGYSEHDEVPGTPFRGWKFLIHVISLPSSVVGLYRARHSRSNTCFWARARPLNRVNGPPNSCSA